jgi:hypothetical protein
MPDTRDQGAIPQGLIEQSRARPVDPGKLQLLGKQAAAIYSDKGTPLNEAVLSVIGREDLGPEHARRVCEFANQEAFQREWEKGGSVRNVEFTGGPADPAVVMRELNDGARPDSVCVSDYDEPPVKTARADRRVEEEIFGKYAQVMTHPSEVPSPLPDMHRMRQQLSGAQDHIHSKISSLEVSKEAVARDLGDAVCDAVLSGNSLHKISSAWSHFCSRQDLFKEALDVSIARMRERGVPSAELEAEKLAGQEPVGRIPNMEHPLVVKFRAFTKIAAHLRTLQQAISVVGEQIPRVDEVLRGGR